MPALQQQADVVLQVEVPGKGKAVVLGVYQAYAGNPAAEMGDLFHPATLPPAGRNDLGQNCGPRSARPARQWHHRHGQAGDAARLAVVATEADVPDMGGAPQVDRPGHRGDPAAAQATQVVGVHFQADAVVLAGIDAQGSWPSSPGFPRGPPEAPPCSRPNGWWVRESTGMLAVSDSSSKASKRMPSRSPMLFFCEAFSCSRSARLSPEAHGNSLAQGSQGLPVGGSHSCQSTASRRSTHSWKREP